MTNALTFGGQNLLLKGGGYDERYMSRADSIAWGAGEIVGTIASVALGIGAARGLATATQGSKFFAQGAKAWHRYQVAGGLFTAGEGAYEAYEDYAAGKGVSWMSGLKIGGGLLGARMDAGALAKAGGLGRVGRGVLAGSEALEGLGLGAARLGARGGVAAGQALSNAAKWAAKLGPEAREGAKWAERNLPTLNAVLDKAIHGGLSKVSTRAHDFAADIANRLGFKACFAAGTPLYAKDGAKSIELFRSYEKFGDDCDWVVSRNEHNDDSPLVLRRVLRRFEREALVLDLRAGGRTIGTTAEHPFFAKGTGWVAAQELRPGDEVRLMAPGWVTVESVVDTGRWETVYNLEVEDDHTYFVGCDDWGFSVWAHNNNGCEVVVGEMERLGLVTKKQADALRQGIKQDPALRLAFEEIGGLQGMAQLLGVDLAKKMKPEIMAQLVKDRSPLMFERLSSGGYALSPEGYKLLRKRTPSAEIQDMVNKGVALPMSDAALPGQIVTTSLHADHIVSMQRITQLNGFNNLNYENMLRVLNYKPNFIGLSEAANTSKGAKSFAQWTRHDILGIDVDPAFRANMMAREQVLEPQLQKIVDALLAHQPK